MRPTRIVHGLIALTLAAPAWLGATGGAANAVTVAQRCTTLKGTATISPGLTNTPADQKVVAKGSLKGCSPSTATGGSGSLRVVILLQQATCASLAGAQTLKGTGKVTWADATTSSVNFRATTTSTDPTLATIGGKVTAGKFVNKLLGGKIRLTPVFTGTGTACSATNPLQTLTFTNKISDTQTVNFRIYTS